MLAPSEALVDKTLKGKDANMPRVSVIMPAYNAVRFLSEAVDSVLKQTFQDFELIVVDDGSTDRTRDVVAEFFDPRIHYIYQDNRGPAAARNAGIAAARGEFIAPLDSDDLALPHRLTTQMSYLEAEPALSVVGSGYEWIDEQGQRIPWNNHSWQKYPELNDLKDWLFDCPFVPSATMFRRTAWEDVNGFDEELIGPEDWNFWMRLVLKGHRMTWQHDVVCLYRHRQDSVSQNAQQQTANCAKALRRIMADPSFPPTLLRVGEQGLAIRYVDGTKRLYTSGLWNEGKTALEEALRLDPGLLEGQPSRVEDELISACMDPLVDDPVFLLLSIFQNLPANGLVLRDRRRHMLARCHLESLVRGLGRRDIILVRKHLLPTAVMLPQQLCDHSTWAFVRRAIENRLRRLIRLVRRPKKGTS